MSQCAAEIYRNLAINKCLEYMHFQMDSACCIEDRERTVEAYKEVVRLICISLDEANEVESFQLPEVI